MFVDTYTDNLRVHSSPSTTEVDLTQILLYILS
jgi:hypothetical protein